MADNVDELLNGHACSCEEYSSFILSCNVIGQGENKSRYVTEIVFWLGFADVIFGGTSDRKYVCVRRLQFPRKLFGKCHTTKHMVFKGLHSRFCIFAELSLIC